ncbi:hypothetical protein KUTeg_004335 [Tegillarca granosa]|uniref:Uncharacterized protein n=1 Tax=Tegillarca granosa TaxID=220873 RepID=A0ABQ9FPM7_TEGGR|nr:hypothetical protein KUTeg_004335 [Tegillarca granosa]
MEFFNMSNVTILFVIFCSFLASAFGGFTKDGGYIGKYPGGCVSHDECPSDENCIHDELETLCPEGDDKNCREFLNVHIIQIYKSVCQLLLSRFPSYINAHNLPSGDDVIFAIYKLIKNTSLPSAFYGYTCPKNRYHQLQVNCTTLP